jgi:hypothetical protein
VSLRAKRVALVLLQALLLGLAMNWPVWADHPELSEAQMAQSSDLIVLGQFMGHAVIQPGGVAVNIGVVRVDRSFKGEVGSAAWCCCACRRSGLLGCA